MSDTEKEVEAAEEQDAEFEEPAPDIVVTKKSGASATVAWLALFLALLTTASVGYLYLERYRADNVADDQDTVATQLSQQLQSTNDSLGALDSKISDLAAAEQRANALIDALRGDLDERAELLDSLPSRTNNLERSIAALQGVSLDTRNTYLVAEAEYYLQIANSQLQLAGNPYLATLALEQADDRLLQLADPALTEVRRAIANEIAALEVMEKPDISGVALTLASLARVVDSLPLVKAAGEESASDDDTGEAPGGAARAWAAVKGAFTGLVKHTPPQDRQAPLLTPDAEPMIRSNLALQLQAARLALLRGEQQVFEQSIDDASEWIRAYFDTSGAPVQSALETLAEIRAGYSTSVAPDISGSLKLLRQYETLSEPVE
ncbi:MAG: uroporphyrinogen-III C-methyltransferase [Gammaproteobacteria bacterium]|nr:uroporphyrinogen-III C-methyltransferase [Gammaproteobacteria bacterium]